MRRLGGTDLHHLEVSLARGAFRAEPIVGHVLPARARREAGLGQAHGRAGTVVSAGQDQARARVHAAANAFAQVAQQTGIGADQALHIIKAVLKPSPLAE